MDKNLEIVLKYLKKEGPKSLSELENNPPKGINGNEARVALEKLVTHYQEKYHIDMDENYKFCINNGYERMKIRDFSPKDVNQVLKLWKRTGLYFDKWDTKRNLLKKYEFEKNLEASLFVVAEDKKIVGTVMGVYNGWVSKIDHLAVDPDYQCNGLGTILMGAIEERFKINGAKTVLLDVVMSNNKVLKFYNGLGYTIKANTYSLRKDLK